MRRLRWIYMVNGLLFFVLFLVFLRIFLFTPVIVKGDSMDSTLVNGQQILTVSHTKIKRFDIITFLAPDEENTNYIKRVIGLPGDEIEYKNDILYINKKAYAEPYLDENKNKYAASLPLTNDFTLTELYGLNKVPEGMYFVLGDNRPVSKDSRYAEVGFIDEKAILGDARFGFFPLNRIGEIK